MRGSVAGLVFHAALLCAPRGALALDAPAQSCRVVEALPESMWTRGAHGARVHESDGDVDGDGATDHLRIVRDGGSGESSVTVTIRSSRFDVELEVVSVVSFYSFLAIARVPDALLDDARRPLREAFEDALFGRNCDRPDPSMEWLLDEQHSLRWYAGPPQMPTTYTILMRDEAYLENLRKVAREQGETYDAQAVWLTYLGDNHQRTREPQKDGEIPFVLAKQGARVLLGTAHGVILTTPRRDRHAWIYVRIGGQKLRFPSIEAASFRRGEVLVRWMLGQYETQGESKVNLRTGRMSERTCPVRDKKGRRRKRCP